MHREPFSRSCRSRPTGWLFPYLDAVRTRTLFKGCAAPEPWTAGHFLCVDRGGLAPVTACQRPLAAAWRASRAGFGGTVELPKLHVAIHLDGEHRVSNVANANGQTVQFPTPLRSSPRFFGHDVLIARSIPLVPDQDCRSTREAELIKKNKRASANVSVGIETPIQSDGVALNVPPNPRVIVAEVVVLRPGSRGSSPDLSCGAGRQERVPRTLRRSASADHRE
ncbi:hypothetical protein DSM104440_00127 [Usitatibacter palustris]|uniref:Uncharacterized protein n=1 Tax=Usitatibacter palustris TaxID=2732487 RepID=A0A6M4H4D7_9PROT|nr:hypothetical protein DSM104440_00127 [Usitatibacter palustris]